MINVSVSNKQWDKVLVIFGGRSDIWWLRFLKKGFKHCFVVLFDNKKGIGVLVDPLCSRTVVDVSFLENTDFLRDFFEANGYTVVETFIRSPNPRTVTLGMFSCVQVVKRILGVHKKSIVTPYKLYRFLQK
ncbi:MAG: hypothetical protein IKD08_06455 [Alphaproteobacteria bacterium]|nr:hypothetical protein [Alphaproteobacteria bacterium]